MGQAGVVAGGLPWLGSIAAAIGQVTVGDPVGAGVVQLGFLKSMVRMTLAEGTVAKVEQKISMTVYLTRGQLDKLKELRARTKVPVAEYIRSGIDLALTAHAAELGQRPGVE